VSRVSAIRRISRCPTAMSVPLRVLGSRCADPKTGQSTLELAPRSPTRGNLRAPLLRSYHCVVPPMAPDRDKPLFIVCYSSHPTYLSDFLLEASHDHSHLPIFSNHLAVRCWFRYSGSGMLTDFLALLESPNFSGTSAVLALS
jgi:hypothetical protein